MATLTVQDIAVDGLTPSYVAADVAGDEFANSARAFVHVKNGGVSSVNVTIASQFAPSPGVGPADIVISIPAGGETMAGPLNNRVFNNADGNVELTYSDVTNVTVAALSL